MIKFFDEARRYEQLSALDRVELNLVDAMLPRGKRLKQSTESERDELERFFRDFVAKAGEISLSAEVMERPIAELLEAMRQQRTRHD